jgi:predicted nucleic acid-binding protein
MFTTAVSEAEVFYGLTVLPKGRRRRALEEAAAGLFADFEGRVLSFDSAAARAFAEIAAARRGAGRPMSLADAQIAAIAASRGARLATRNVGDFDLCGVDIVDPWRAS